jgi:flagellar hook-associated protein 1
MGSINSALNVITSALDAEQAALNTVANNVANANTTGYSRQIVNFSENSPVQINGYSVGTGVSYSGATSVRDSVLEQRLAQQTQLSSSASSRLSALDSLQALFTPASGSSSSTAGDIGSDITSFFSSFTSLEANPTNSALRQSVLSSATTLAGDISNAAASINSQRSALDQEATGVVSQVNALTKDIAQLNQQIQSTSANTDAGALEDQRQQDILDLSKLIGINQISTENNGLSITTTSGQLLVSQSNSFQLSTSNSGGVSSFILNGADITSQLTSGGGELGGYLTARDQDLPSALSSLDQLAYSVTTQVNAINNSGTDLNGNQGTGTNSSGVTGTGSTPLYIFNEPTQVGGSALSMSVVMTDPNQIAAAGLGKGSGDNSNSVLLASLSNSTVVNGSTPTNYYSQFVSQLGSTVSQVQTDNTSYSASVTQIQSQINSLSGVNLNDEAASMQQFERAYQAASEVFTILNQVYASAINLGVQTSVS